MKRTGLSVAAFGAPALVAWTSHSLWRKTAIPCRVVCAAFSTGDCRFSMFHLGPQDPDGT